VDDALQLIGMWVKVRRPDWQNDSARERADRGYPVQPQTRVSLHVGMRNSGFVPASRSQILSAPFAVTVYTNAR